MKILFKLAIYPSAGLASLRNLTKISESRVTLSDDGQVVAGPLDFDGMVIFESDVDLLGRIKGITLLDIKRGWLDFLEEISGNITRLRWLSSELCDIIDDLQLIYEGNKWQCCCSRCHWYFCQCFSADIHHQQC